MTGVAGGRFIPGRSVTGTYLPVAVQLDKEARRTRDFCVAKARHFARLAQIPRAAKEACSG
jgi:hypothetical protein